MADKPTLGQRIRYAIARKALGGEVIADKVGLVSGVLGKRGEPPAKTTADFLKAFSTHPWLHAVAWRIATAVAAVPWGVFAVQGGEGSSERWLRPRKLQTAGAPYRGRMMHKLHLAGDLVEFEEHPFLDLWTDANPWHTGVSMRRLWQLYLDLVGEAFGILERNEFGVPVRAWPVPAHWVRSTPTPTNPFYEVNFGAWVSMIPATEMLWLSQPNPTNPYGRGVGTAQSLGDELDTSEHLAKFQKAFFYNRARPDVLVTAPELTPKQSDEFMAKWQREHRGFWKAFRPMIMSFDAKITPLTQSLQSMEITQLSDAKRDTVVQVFGVPPEVVGIIENSNRATIQGADHIFAKYVLEPRLEFLRSYFQERLGSEYDNRIIIDYESPVGEDKDFMLKVAEAAPWSRRVNEWRELQGLDPLAPEEGGEHFAVPHSVSFNETLVSEPSPFAAADFGPTLEGLTLGYLGNGKGFLTRPMPSVDAGETYEHFIGRCHEALAGEFDDPAQRNAVCEGIWEGRSISRGTSLVKQEVDDPFYIIVHRIADRLEPAVRRLFLRAVRDTAAAIDETALVAIEAALRAGNVEGVLARIPFPIINATLRGLREPLLAAVEEAARASAREVAQLLAIEFVFDDTNPAAITWVERHALDLAVELEASTKEGIRELVRASVGGKMDWRKLARAIKANRLGLTATQQGYVSNFEAGLIADGATDIEARVARYAEAWKRRRAETIARTETINASNQGQQVVWEQGVREGAIDNKLARKIWIVTPDDRLDRKVCEPMPHMEVNQNVPINGMFTTPQGMRIGQPTAHPRCRCATALLILTARGFVLRLGRCAICAQRLPEVRWQDRMAPEGQMHIAGQLV